ncbi:nitrate reductase molybdenum cofactor assembly chaperone [Nocardia jinanensis]|uniref:Nitrate reductase molybdenum cofactor assembly chaperone n=1 Tax=Nocardia jinanensis TaxID=382504 RepID=A0A917RRD0_9NOCA|nr:nitrate reductase molybdenum cofactor assembly chaperone [Nocardia jinanensis]GGL21113.1 nitrate reductase molybdenum cofactor assembly chaperone [Nocardia jinanensis]
MKAARGLDPAARAAAWQVQSLLLGYPDESLRRTMDLLGTVAATLPSPVGAPLTRFLSHVRTRSVFELAADYVATFDHRKRFSPYLTYFAYGDTRKRGVALLRFKQAYREAGLKLSDEELPDHLSVVLEFAASGNAETGLRLLIEHRAGLEVMRRGLRDSGSPWADILESVTATLPALAGSEEDAVARLIAEGPPEEAVGLAPFTPPQYLPDPVVARPGTGRAGPDTSSVYSGSPAPPEAGQMNTEARR